MSIAMATITGDYRRPDGTVSNGRIQVILNVDGKTVRDPEGRIIYAGDQLIEIPADGNVSFELAPVDAATVPTGFSYTLVEQLDGIDRFKWRKLTITPAAGTTTDLATIEGGEVAIPVYPPAVDQTTFTGLATQVYELQGEVADLSSGKADASALASEVSRAEAAETTLAGRATALEGDVAGLHASKANAVDLTAEVSRAEAAETTLAGRATALEGDVAGLHASKANAVDLTAEVSRAEAAESGLAANLATEVSRAEAAEAGKQDHATLEHDVAAKIGTGGELDRAVRNVTKFLKRDFGAVGDGTADDTAALTAALAPSKGATPNAWPSGTYVDLVIEPGIYKINPNQVTWDYSRCRIVNASGAQIKVMTTASGDVGIKVLLTTPDSSGALSKTMLSTGLEVTCGNAARVGIGMSVAGVSTGTPGDMTTTYRSASSFKAQGWHVSGFDVALKFGDNAYMLTFDSCAFISCNQGVVFPAVFTNSGERIRFTDCLFGDQVGGTRGSGGTYPQIYNANHPYISMGGDQTLQFDNCSFDWIAQLLEVATNGIVSFDQCHFETPSSLVLATTAEIVDAARAYALVHDHAKVFINQSRFLMAAGDPPNIVPYLFDIDGWGNVIIRDSEAYFNPGIAGGSFPSSMGAFQAWANRPNIVLDGLIYLKNQPEQQPHVTIPSDGASLVEHSYSLSSLDPGISFGSTSNGTGGLSNTDLPPGPPAGIQNAMAFIGATQYMTVTKSVGFTPRYLTFDFWAKATGTATGLYPKIGLTRGGAEVAVVAPPAVPITTTWKRYRLVLDARHVSGGTGRFEGSDCFYQFLGVPGGDNSAKIAGMAMGAWA
jgi:hypothetical protein